MKRERSHIEIVKAGTRRIMRHSANPERYVFAKKPRCPKCGSTDLQTIRSIADQGDGTTWRKTRCRRSDCDHTFNLILE